MRSRTLLVLVSFAAATGHGAASGALGVAVGALGIGLAVSGCSHGNTDSIGDDASASDPGQDLAVPPGTHRDMSIPKGGSPDLSVPRTNGCQDDLTCPAKDGYCLPGTNRCGTLTPGACANNRPAGCAGVQPRCVDSSCFNPGACRSAADCHQGESCTVRGGTSLCFPTSPCGSTVSTTDVANGLYAAGKEVCIRDRVSNVIVENDGDYHIRMGGFGTPVCGANNSPTNCPTTNCPFPVNPPGNGLITELTPDYQKAGITTPTIGSTITVQGTVRWDGAHCWWELHPIKYWK